METIRVATIGDVGPALAKFDAGDRQIPIRVLFDESARTDLKLPGARSVWRRTRQRAAVGGRRYTARSGTDQHQPLRSPRQAVADLVGSVGDAMVKINELPVLKSLPKGVKVGQSGDAEDLQELADGFATAISSGLMMVYAVLVLLFGTFLQPITILFSLPLSIGGAILALVLTGISDHSGADRLHHADGHRHQERHHAGRFCDESILGHEARRSDRRRHEARGRSS